MIKEIEDYNTYRAGQPFYLQNTSVTGCDFIDNIIEITIVQNCPSIFLAKNILSLRNLLCFNKKLLYIEKSSIYQENMSI